MPKFNVTKNMGSALKNLRQMRRIRAVDIAKSVGKTGAYISKLEKGELNTIEEELFIAIIKSMSNTKDEFNDAIDIILQDTSMEYTDEEADNEEWKMNIDLSHRQLPIPPEYTSFVKEKMEILKISSKDLAKYISSNIDLYSNKSFSKELLDNAKKNIWVFNNGNSFIVMDISSNEIDDILEHKIETTNYNRLLCILLSIFRLEKYSIEDSNEKAIAVLHDMKIFTLDEKSEIMGSFNRKQSMDDFFSQSENVDLPEDDRELINYLFKFTKHIKDFATIDIKYVNTKLSTVINNFENDPVLLMGYMGVDLSKLKNTDIKVRKEFVNAVSLLIDEYSNKTIIDDKPDLI